METFKPIWKHRSPFKTSQKWGGDCVTPSCWRAVVVRLASDDGERINEFGGAGGTADAHSAHAYTAHCNCGICDATQRRRQLHQQRHLSSCLFWKLHILETSENSLLVSFDACHIAMVIRRWHANSVTSDEPFQIYRKYLVISGVNPFKKLHLCALNVVTIFRS